MKENQIDKKRNKLNYNQNNTNKSSIYSKIALAILCIIIMSLVILFMVESFILNEISYFSQHFSTAIILICLGFIIMILVSSNKARVVGESKGDNFMEKVAIISFILGLLSIAISYISF